MAHVQMPPNVFRVACALVETAGLHKTAGMTVEATTKALCDLDRSLADIKAQGQASEAARKRDQSRQPELPLR